MTVLVVGSVAYDSVETPAGRRDDALGGSATYFSVSCSNFAPVSLVGVVGEDFRDADVELLRSHGVDLSGLERARGADVPLVGGLRAGRTSIRRMTLDTQLNVFADFAPRLSGAQCEAPYLFLANIAPSLQLDVLQQMRERPKLVALDTMNFWIEGSGAELKEVVQQVDIVFMDENEARSFTESVNLMQAAEAIHSMGPRTVVVKRGEHGAILFHEGQPFLTPAVPLEHVVDPTGAGDTFAGGFLGYLAATKDLTEQGFRRAAVTGSVMASFVVEGFSLERLAVATSEEIETRFRRLSALTRFEPLADDESLPMRMR